MRKKICFIVAIPETATIFLKNHILELSKRYDIYIVANFKGVSEDLELPLSGYFHAEIMREINILKDIKALINLYRYFKRMKFDSVHSVTPKAGLLTAIAARFAGIKHRTHIFTGQVWATRSGYMRSILKCFDRLIVALNNHIIVDGKSQRDFLIQENIINKNQAIVFGEGSISGVDIERFSPSHTVRINIRKKLAITDNQIVIIFLGRLKFDKGVSILLEAFNRLVENYNNAFLLIVGRDEENYISQFSQYKNIHPQINFYYYGPSSEPESLLAASDIFVMPSFREGFGSSVIEASSVQLPCICSDVYGIQDSFIEGITGLKCKAGDTQSLYSCLEILVNNRELRNELGINGRSRVVQQFDSKIITKHWIEFYKNILHDK